MTNASAAPGAPPSDTDALLALILGFPNSVPLLSVTVPFANLSPNGRAVFHVLYCLWGRKRLAFCSLKWLAAKTGLSERTVRRALRELEASAMVLTLRVKRRQGGYRNRYAPGPEVARALRELAKRGAARRATPAAAAVAALDSPAEVRAWEMRCDPVSSCGQPDRARAATVADIDFSEKFRSESLTHAAELEPLPSSSAAPAPNRDPFVEIRESAPLPPPAPALVELSDARLARLCLLHLASLAHPHTTLREPSGGGLALATARLAELGELSDEEKLRRGKLAVESAHRRSLRKSGKAPTPGYVFGTQSYFVGHLERAEREAARAARPPVAPSERDSLAASRVTPKASPALPEASPPVPFERDTAPVPSPAPPAVAADAPESAEPPERFAEHRRAAEERARATEARRLEAERQRARARLEAFALAGELAECAAPPPPRPVEAEELARARAKLLAMLTPEDRAALEQAEARARLCLRARQSA